MGKQSSKDLNQCPDRDVTGSGLARGITIRAPGCHSFKLAFLAGLPGQGAWALGAEGIPLALGPLQVLGVMYNRVATVRLRGDWERKRDFSLGRVLFVRRESLTDHSLAGGSPGPVPHGGVTV